MIETLVLEEFKAFRNAEIHFGRLTVLVGPNASGKTSVLEALHYLSQLGHKPPIVLLVGQRDPAVLRRRAATGPTRLRLIGRWDGQPGELLLRVSPNPGETPPWRLLLEGVWGRERISFTTELRSGEAEPVLSPSDHPLSKKVASCVLLRFDPVRLAEPSYSERLYSRVEYDGYGLASVLAEMLLSRRDAFELLQAAVRDVIPTLQELNFFKEKLRDSSLEPVKDDHFKVVEHVHDGYRLEVDMVGARHLPAHAVSEGTLLVIGLLTILMSPAAPRLVLMDNIERGLHPKAMGELIKHMRTILEKQPDLQIVATSHSPYLIDHLDPSEVLLTTCQEDGCALCAPLTEHPDFEKWRDLMSPGEFWSTVGEDWAKRQAKATHG